MREIQDEAEQLWEETRQALRRELSRPSYDTWLKNTKPLSLEDNVLLLGVPSDFARDWLQTRLYASIQRALHSVRSEEIEVEFRVVSMEPAELPPATADAPGQEQRLAFNPRYTFGSFVVGASNRFAHAACLAVANAPGRAYNPLFVYGGVGLGKTHLLQAIGNHILEATPQLKVIYLSSEKFTNDVINGIRDHRMGGFRDHYRTVDVILIDDIQFIAGKESTQEEFFHTFNALHDSSKQIILTSDKLPRDIPTLEDRLRSRFEWGLLADVQLPDLETRIAILKKRIGSESIEVPAEVLAYIADNITSNIRELEGALTRILAYASLYNQEIDLSMTMYVLKDLIPVTTRPLSVAEIQKAVAGYFQIPTEVLLAKKRSRDVVIPRHIAMYLARELTDFSLPQLGESFGGRDHTTVLYACDKIRTEKEADINLQTALDEIRKLLLRPLH
ncbi:MAG: chromosomal replication initiator protein DnaA [Coprothermobacterota bacterium]|nr:chromosomal replication initiator protein DnaA [Coprothermobacterota bacterium]